MDPEIVKQNVLKLHAKGASEEDIRAYIEGSGLQKIEQPKPDVLSREAIAPLAQGATMGFADEALGAVNGANEWLHGRGFQKGYHEGVEKTRQAGKNYAAANPKASAALEIAGSLVPAVASGVAQGGVKAAAKAGAKFGAVSGFGSTDGDLTDRARGALAGGAGGAVLGGAVGALPVASRVARNMIGLRGKGASAGLADELVEKSLTRDKIDPQELLRRANEAQATGKPHILPDLGGENTLGLGRAAQATPSKAKDELSKFLTERHTEQAARMGPDLEAGIRTGRKDVHEVADQLIANRKAAAKPLYDAAYSKGPINDPEVVKLFELPRFQQAYQVGRRIAATEGENLPDLVGATKQFGSDVARKVAPPTVKALDYTKRGLDDLIDSKMRSGRMGRSEARALRTKLDSMLERVDKKVPEYKAARQQFAGDSRLMDALENGRNYLKEDPRVSTKAIGRLSEGEREMYKTGAMDAIRQEMEKAQDGADLTKRIFGSSDKRDKLRVLFPDEKSFSAFAKQVETEANLVKTKNVILGGSPTARIASELADLGGENIGEAAMRGAVAGPKGMIFRAGAAAMKNRAQGITGNVADELSQRMMMGPKEIAKYTQLLEKMQAARLKAAGKNSVAARVAGLSAGRIAGGL